MSHLLKQVCCSITKNWLAFAPGRRHLNPWNSLSERHAFVIHGGAMERTDQARKTNQVIRGKLRSINPAYVMRPQEKLWTLGEFPGR